MADSSWVPCHQEQQTERIRFYYDQSGEIKQKVKLFSDLTSISVHETYKDGKPINRKVYNSNQKQTAEIDFEYFPDGSYLKTKYSLDPFRSFILSKERLVENGKGRKKLEEWQYEKDDDGVRKLKSHVVFRKDSENTPEWVAVYNDAEEFQFWQKLKYEDELERIIGIEFFDGDKIRFSQYSSEWSPKIENLKESGLLSKEPLGVVVIDSGFEIDHPMLNGKWYDNPLEALDGVDNDGNGMVDEIFGYHKFQGGEFSSNIQETFKVKKFPGELFSHGTHVAGLAMEGVTGWSLAGFSGDFTDKQFIQYISQFLSKHQARFVNMSYSFGKRRGNMSPPKESFTQLSEMIRENAETLFFVAAGNDPVDIDMLYEFPASFNFKNTVVVGALDARQWQSIPSVSYAKAADFSSFGIRDVDVFAPGEEVSSALIGHRLGAKSGTSMATPKVLNVVARAAEIYPQVSGQELKQALLLSVYIPDLENPLPCLSGGVVYEKRFLDVLKLYSLGYSLKDAALKSRIDSDSLEGESQSWTYFTELQSFWDSRNL